MLSGFKKFIMRGNVVDLAVGVVIGAAFTALVTQFTDSFLTPLIKAIGASPSSVGGRIDLPGDDNYLDVGAFIGAVITFVLTAAVVYFLVVTPMNRLAERMRSAEEPPPPALPSEEVQLLREIRDALVAQRVPAQGRESTAERGAGSDT